MDVLFDPIADFETLENQESKPMRFEDEKR